MGRIVIKLLSPCTITVLSFLLWYYIVCIYDTTSFAKYLVQLRELLSLDVTGYFWSMA